MRRIVRRTKWFHVHWSTVDNRQLFKIAAAARFCERFVCDRCSAFGIRVDSIAIQSRRMNLLVETPHNMRRDELMLIIRKAAVRGARRGAQLPVWDRRLWRQNCWCATLRGETAVWTVRRHIQALASGCRPSATENPDLPTVTWLND